MTDATGTIVGEDRFYPFGETRFTTGTMLTDKLFTGQRAMAGLGIYHYGARFYSPKLGRFLSADSIVPGYANPQNLNRYSYVMNNPLRYIDPTGHKCVSTGPGDCLNEKGKPINGAGGLTPKKKKSGNNGGGDQPGCGIDGTAAYGFHCSKKDIDGATLQQRLDWFSWLTGTMNDNIGPGTSDWFTNVKTVIKGFIFSGQDYQSQWVLNVDASILLAIQDGYVASIGYYSGASLETNLGAGLWQQFFNSLSDPNVAEDTLIEQWGRAEQAGTNEGLQGTNAEAGWDDQAFTFVGNIYRGAGGWWCKIRTCVGGFFDPRSTSLFGVELGYSPVALAQYPIYDYDFLYYHAQIIQ